MKDFKISNKNKKLIFALVILILPIIHVCVFYIGVNFKQILIAFSEYNIVSNVYSFNGLENFKEVFRKMTEEVALRSSLKNSTIVFLTIGGLGNFLSLVLSVYIYKKRFLHGFFKIALFLPHVISIVVLVVIFRFICNDAVPYVANELFGISMEGLLYTDKAFNVILFFALFTTLGTSVLMYSSAMSGISESIIEAAEIDGFNYIQEFWFIIIPMIFPTIKTFIVIAFAAYFTNQMHLFTFYGNRPDNPSYYTYGYYLYSKVVIANGNETTYPILSAMGILFTVIIVPITFTIKRIMDKYGPSVD